VSPRRRATGVALLCLAALVAAGLAGASAGRAGEPPATLDVRARFPKLIAEIARGTEIRVLIPRAVTSSNVKEKLYFDGIYGPDRWSATIGAAPSCGTATACFVASFAGRRGAVLQRANLRLPSGQRARYVPIRCGASCGPATLSFLHLGVRYDWRLKEPPPGGARVLARLATDAIAATRP